MGDFSRDPQQRLMDSVARHYVGVRLQQGVPLLDADWNESEALRRWELRSFLRSFVGDGFPEENPGFEIKALAAGNANDFLILGGDGTPQGAGRCLVRGWEVLNEDSLKYSEQPLYDDEALAAQLDVLPLKPLTTPDGSRTDAVYLDVWEREVDAGEDGDHLVDPRIGIETSVRIKREWVVRVAEGSEAIPAEPAGHAYLPLAVLTRQGAEIAAGEIHDIRRRTGLLRSLDVEQTVLDRRVKTLQNAVENLALRSRIDALPSSVPELAKVVTEAYSEAAGFRRLVDRFETNAEFQKPFYYPRNPRGSQTEHRDRVQTQALVDTEQRITRLLVVDKARTFGPLAIDPTTVDVSLDGGSTWLTGQPLATEIDTRELRPNGDRFQLVLRFNLVAAIASPGDFWTTLRSLPEGRSHLAAAAGAGGKIYALGGNGADGQSPVAAAEVFEYDPLTDAWDTVLRMNRARHQFAAVALSNHRIYALGGNGDTSLVREVEFYDPRTGDWSIVDALLPTARQQCAAAVRSNDRIHVIGGLEEVALDVHEELDPVTASWTTRAATPEARQGAVGAVDSGDRILVYGGVRPGPSPALGRLDRYDPASDSWTALAAMAAPRGTHAGASVSNDFAYAFGGFEERKKTPTATNQEYDPDRDVWTVRADLPEQTRAAAAAAAGESIHVLGGWDADRNRLAHHHQYRPFLTTKTRQFGFGLEYQTSE